MQAMGFVMLPRIEQSVVGMEVIVVNKHVLNLLKWTISILSIVEWVGKIMKVDLTIVKIHGIPPLLLPPPRGLHHHQVKHLPVLVFPLHTPINVIPLKMVMVIAMTMVYKILLPVVGMGVIVVHKLVENPTTRKLPILHRVTMRQD